MEKNKRQSILSWSLMLALLMFCAVLGALQYRWIGEVSVAARERLHGSLQTSLNQLSRDFDAQIVAACLRLIPPEEVPDTVAAEAMVRERWQRSRANGQDTRMFRSVALAEKETGGLVLRTLNLETGIFQAASWPADWTAVRERMESRLPGELRSGRGPLDRGANDGRRSDQAAVFEAPLWGSEGDGRFGRRESAWLIFELNVPYLRDVLLPATIRRHLSTGDSLEYQVEVASRDSDSVVYRSDANQPDLIKNADASVGLFRLTSAPLMEGGRGGDAPERGTVPPARGAGPHGPGPDASRWQMYVRNRAGSLEAVVARTRRLNMLVTSGVLLLMLATVAALIRFTRRAQKLAELQMEFVAGVSHELRTPLTVIHTAAYNLQGAIANHPKQVERYGAVIQQESGRLKELVEQVLQFASASAGRAIREREAVSVSRVIAEAAESVQSVVDQEGCVLHQNVDPSLPLVLGDPRALKQAIQNLLSNAAKYGSSGGKWIGVEASKSRQNDREMVEIRVLDRGMGIPDDEQSQIFEPFFRGRWAVRNQVHGTGLGLNLVKRVIEAHQGSIEVKSQELQGTEFIIRLPTIPAEEPYAHSVS